jgi:hypothetical protein
VAAGGGVCTDGGISSGGGSGTLGGTLPQPENRPVRVPRIAATKAAPTRWRTRCANSGRFERNKDMTLIILEALGAGLLLVGIVWWTMFSGRRGGERIEDTPEGPDDRRL